MRALYFQKQILARRNALKDAWTKKQR